MYVIPTANMHTNTIILPKLEKKITVLFYIYIYIYILCYNVTTTITVHFSKIITGHHFMT